MDDGREHKRAKGTKKYVTKSTLKFNDYKGCLFKNKIILKSQQSFKIETHNAYTEEIKQQKIKIALSINDDKRSQTFAEIKTYPYGTNAFKVCESEMLK